MTTHHEVETTGETSNKFRAPTDISHCDFQISSTEPPWIQNNKPATSDNKK